MAPSRAVYDFVLAVLRRRSPRPGTRRGALDAATAVWERVLGFEGCAVQFAVALRGMPEGELPEAVAMLLRDATRVALQRAILVHRQLAGVGRLAADAGIRVLALKGAARLLAGETPASRSISDIDLLVSHTDASRFHRLLQEKLRYDATSPAYEHHLAGLTRPGSLGIELHVSLGARPTPLDAEIWTDTRHVAEVAGIEVPSPTNQLLHCLEHATRVNWTARYRLRDIADVAALHALPTEHERVAEHVRRSDAAGAMTTLISAAHAINEAAPLLRADAWATVERVARARVAAASLSPDARIAERLFRYAGVLAEGSPRTIVRAGVALAQRAAAAGALFLTIACSDSVGPSRIDVQPFLFQSGADGTTGIYRFDRGTVRRLSAAGVEDGEPQSAAGRVVFTSRRDGDPEIYIADLQLDGQLRLTNDFANDEMPALSPSGTTVAFVSNRSGTPRVWLVDADGANPRPLDTGSPVYIPEGSPRWNRDGSKLAFTSTRTNTSQVFTIPATGGIAEQLSHEANGAFAPTWSAAGDCVLFSTLADGRSAVVAVTVANGARVEVAAGGAGVTAPTCGASYCLFVVASASGDGDIAAGSLDGTSLQPVLARPADDRAPALLIP